MRILIADDASVYRRLLEAMLVKWGYEVVAYADGTAAWAAVQDPDAPNLLLLDWTMPGMDGIEVCGKVRQAAHLKPTYIILLTARERKDDIVAGLQAGADDYLSKPFDREELRARLQVGVRVLELQRRLAERVTELEDALSHVKQLQGFLPICSYCKKIRDDQNYWRQVEAYLTEHSEARFSHGVCPDCYEKFVTPQLSDSRRRRKENDR